MIALHRLANVPVRWTDLGFEATKERVQATKLQREGITLLHKLIVQLGTSAGIGSCQLLQLW